MSVIDQPTVFDELIDLLAMTADREQLLAFRLSPDRQTRLDDLLEKNREGTLSDGESEELQSFERFEHVVRLLKARVLQKAAR